MSLIPSMLGELTAMCIADIPFFMDICTSTICGVIPICGPGINFVYNQLLNVYLALLGVFG